jgi:hypothetical protein
MEEHEFTEEENKVFNGLIRNMILLAVMIIVGGIGSLSQVRGAENPALMIAEGITYFIMAIVFFLPLNNFRRIVTTEGKDITELMSGFEKIRKAWVLLNIVTAIIVVLRISMLIDVIRNLP